MGPVIVFFLLALAVSCAVLGIVALPHLRERRDSTRDDRHTSRTQRRSA